LTLYAEIVGVDPRVHPCSSFKAHRKPRFGTGVPATEQPTPKYKTNTAQDAKTGVPGAPSLHRADLPTKPSMRRRATPGTHGGDVSNRVSAHAVGRRGHFPEGRLSPEFWNACPSGKCAERGRSTVVGLTATLMRPRRPGLDSGAGPVGRFSGRHQRLHSGRQGSQPSGLQVVSIVLMSNMTYTQRDGSRFQTSRVARRRNRESSILSRSKTGGGVPPPQASMGGNDLDAVLSADAGTRTPLP